VCRPIRRRRRRQKVWGNRDDGRGWRAVAVTASRNIGPTTPDPVPLRDSAQYRPSSTRKASPPIVSYYIHRTWTISFQAQSELTAIRYYSNQEGLSQQRGSTSVPNSPNRRASVYGLPRCFQTNGCVLCFNGRPPSFGSCSRSHSSTLSLGYTPFPGSNVPQ
jgi:hypothetical protein